MTDLAPLTRAEQVALDDCEQRIERGLKTFIEVGQSLAAIREHRLYRAEHETFEGYCQQRWGFNRHRASQLITAVDVVTNVTSAGLPAPANEGQARELAKVPEPDRADVWAEAVERTGGKPTAAAVRQVAEERTAPPFDLKAKIRADLAEIGAEGMPVGGIRLGLPQDIPSGDVDTAIGELVDAGEVLCVGNTPMGATLWALTELVGAEDHPGTGEGRSAGLPSAISGADESDASVVGDVAADDLPGDPEPARPPLLSPDEVRQIEAHGERVRAINHARRVAERFLNEVSGFVTDIEAGVLYGETGLFTEDMAAELRKQADRVERYLEGRQ